MSESEIIKVQYEAIKKFCNGDKNLAMKVITELASDLRKHFVSRSPEKVTPDELFKVISNATEKWKK